MAEPRVFIRFKINVVPFTIYLKSKQTNELLISLTLAESAILVFVNTLSLFQV